MLPSNYVLRHKEGDFDMNRKERLNELLGKLPQPEPLFTFQGIKKRISEYFQSGKAKENAQTAIQKVKVQAEKTGEKLRDTVSQLKTLKSSSDQEKAQLQIRQTIENIQKHLPENGEIPFDSPEVLQKTYETFLSDWQALHGILREVEDGKRELTEEARKVIEGSLGLLKDVIEEIINKAEQQIPSIEDLDVRTRVTQWIEGAKVTVSEKK
ncbi:MAG: hypothetical protein ACE365_03320 [Gammaproteobacteria bacterium]